MKKNHVMRAFVFAIFLALSCSTNKPVKSGYIKFENVGNSDKPINTIIISTDPLPDRDFQKIVLVDPEIFEVLYAFVDEREERYRGKRDASQWFAFEVTTCRDNLIGKYFLPSREMSVKFFNKFLSETEKIKDAKDIGILQYELRIF